jgi:acetyl esterase/lipase
MTASAAVAPPAEPDVFTAVPPTVDGIRYRDGAGVRALGELFLPSRPSGRPPVLLIHGGGWNAMSKESLRPIAGLYAELGRAVFSVNYRLLDDAPWPACRDDCVAAANFMLDGGLASHGLPAPERILISGASAGGHLSMMVGLALPPARVEVIVSMAGPTRLDYPDGTNGAELKGPNWQQKFLGLSREPTFDEVLAAGPLPHVRSDSPPLYSIHSRADRLVTPLHTEQAVEAWRRAGAQAEALWFDGRNDLHSLLHGEDFAHRGIDARVHRILIELFRRLDAEPIPAR